MKTFIASIFLFIFFVLVSCENIDQVGTITAFNKCMKETTTDYVSEESIKASCARRVQKEIIRFYSEGDKTKDILTTSRAGFGSFNNSLVEGTLVNQSGKYIITEFKISVEYNVSHDNNQNLLDCSTEIILSMEDDKIIYVDEEDKCEVKKFTETFYKWIEPNDKGSFSFETYFDPPKVIYRDDKITGEKDNFFWKVTNIKGIEII